MGKNRQKKNSENNSDKWERRFEKGVDVGMKIITAATTIMGGVATYQQIKNNNNNKS